MYVVESVEYDEIQRTAIALNNLNIKTFSDVVFYLHTGRVGLTNTQIEGCND